MSSRVLNLGRMIRSRNPSALKSVARVKSVLRRTGSENRNQSPRLITLADELVIDTERHRVSVRGETLNLTVTEFGILNTSRVDQALFEPAIRSSRPCTGQHHSPAVPLTADRTSSKLGEAVG